MMDINNNDVLDMLNSIIAAKRLNKVEILQIVKLASISNDVTELKDYMNWEIELTNEIYLLKHNNMKIIFLN